MSRALRKLVATAGAVGLATSVFVYTASLHGLTMDGLGRAALLLHVGVLGLFFPMCAIEYPALNDRTFFWKEFACGKPDWVVPAIKVVGLLFVLHLLAFLVLSHAATPDIQNGSYVLNSRGRIVKPLSEGEYLRLKGWELRMFATGWMSFYIVLTMYWWFPRDTSTKLV